MNTHNRWHGGVAVAVAAILAAAMSTRANAQQSPDSQGSSKSQTAVLEEVVVSGIRESILKAQDLKRHADSNIEAITLEDLGKFADSSISDALERVPGIAIEHNTFGLDAIDGVTIRGLGPDYVATTVNGRDQMGVPGFFGSGGRDFDYGSVPPDILAAVTVYKTPTARLYESGLAGEVNLQTLRPLDYKPRNPEKYFGSVNVSGLYDPKAHRAGPQLNGILGVKLFNDTLGIFVAGVYSNQYTKQDRIQEYNGLHDVTLQRPDGSTYVQKNLGDIDGFSPSISYKEYTKRSFATDVQWRPSDQLEINIDGEYNKFTTSNDNHGGDFYTGYNFFTNAVEGGPPIFQPGSYVIRGNQLIDYNDSLITRPPGAPGDFTYASILRDANHNDFWNVGFNAVWHIDSRNKLTFDYAHGNAVYFDDWRGPFMDSSGATMGGGLNAIFDGGSKTPLVTVLQAPGINISNPASYGNLGWFAFQDVTRQKRDQFRVDLDHVLSDHFTLAVGARYSATTYKTALGYGPSPAAGSVSGTGLLSGGNLFYGYNVPIPDLNYNAYCALPGQAYYCNSTNYGFGSFAGFALPTNPNGSPADIYAFQAPQSGRLYETNTAYYGQLDADGELFGLESSGNFGVRAVRIGEQGLSYQGTTYVYSFGGGPDPVNGKFDSSTLFADRVSYWEILPAANFLLKPRDNINVRLGAAKTMSLAAPSGLIPNVSLQIETPYNGGIAPSQLTANNLHLRPTTAWNYDFTVEYYTDYQAAYVFSLFYKNVKDLGTTVTQINVPLPQQYVSLLPAGKPNSGFTVMTPANANYGDTYGLELGTNQPFTFLRSPWDGFGLQANYTYVASTLHLVGEPNATSFPGSSKNNVNATFYYDKYGWDVRVAYAYRNSYLSSVGTNDQSLYTYAYTTLDASISKELGNHLEVMLSASNLTDSPIVNYTGSGRMLYGYLERPRTYTLGIRGKF